MDEKNWIQPAPMIFWTRLEAMCHSTEMPWSRWGGVVFQCTVWEFGMEKCRSWGFSHIIFHSPEAPFLWYFGRRGQLNVQAVKPAVRCSENDRWLPQWPPPRQWYLRWVNRSDSRKGLGCSFFTTSEHIEKSFATLLQKESDVFPSKMWPNIFGQWNRRRMWQLLFFLAKEA